MDALASFLVEGESVERRHTLWRVTPMVRTDISISDYNVQRRSRFEDRCSKFDVRV